MSAPDPQHVLDLFEGEWSSKLPGSLSHLHAGDAPLFEDPRIDWFIERVGGVAGKSALELGPLEGGHTYMLEQAGAESVTAVEANSRAYLRCLVLKEIVGVKKVDFLCGNFVEYLKTADRQFDVCLASGVLYHMANPVELIALLSQHCAQVCLWTHYFDDEHLKANKDQLYHFSGTEDLEYEGFKCTAHRRTYKKTLKWKGFRGGGQDYSLWLDRDTIINVLGHFGFSVDAIGFDEPEHPNGPAFALVASRSAT